MKPEAVIFDIDGTLADISHRLHFVKNGKKNWRGFFEAMVDDSLRQDVYKLYASFAENYPILIVSGRPNNYRKLTQDWLEKHNIYYYNLLMRRAGDYRSDVIVKSEILDEIQKQYDVVVVVDDRPSVIKMWKEHGLHVIDVGNGTEF